MKTGKLLRSVVYLVWKNVDGSGDDRYYRAPEGARVEWTGGTNEGYEYCYGDRFLYWCDLPGYGSRGLEEGVDFEWDEEE